MILIGQFLLLDHRVTLTCCDSLINPVTNKFYFGTKQAVKV